MGSDSSSNLVPFGGRADAAPNAAPSASVISARSADPYLDGSSRPASAVPSAGSRPSSAARSAVAGGAHWLTSQGGPGSGVGGLIGSGSSRPGSGCSLSRPLTPDFSLCSSRAALGTALLAGMRVAGGGGGHSGNGVLGGAGGGPGVVLGASVPAGGGLAACRGLAAAAGSHGAVVGGVSGRHLPGPPPPPPLLSAASLGAMRPYSTAALPTFSERDAGALSSKAAADVTSTRRIVRRDKLERKLVSR